MIKSHVFSYTDIFVFPKTSLKAVTCDALKFSLRVWQLQGHLAATVYHIRSSCWGDTSAAFCPWRPCTLISWEMWLSGLRLCEDQVLEMMAAAWSNCRATAAPSVKIPAHLIQPHVLWFGGPLYKQMADTMKELGHPHTSNRKCDIYIYMHHLKGLIRKTGVHTFQCQAQQFKSLLWSSTFHKETSFNRQFRLNSTTWLSELLWQMLQRKLWLVSLHTYL